MKPILIISILFQLLSYTGRSQTITIENNKLCFDSAASVELYKTIIDRESFAQEVDIYQEAFANYDTAFKKQEELIELQKVLTYEAEKKYQAEKMIIRKQKLKVKNKSANRSGLELQQA
ncbi:MAG: hypothetical protein HC905_22770 [Bacteroidales bacterium]|nr:hypothetical protein [Bacteroidales bacterium]